VTFRQETIPPDCGFFETLIFKLCFMYSPLSESVYVLPSNY
jgi:hypothetical protein